MKDSKLIHDEQFVRSLFLKTKVVTTWQNLNLEITIYIGILSEGAKGWNKELNLISWNDREPKYDIREWSSEHDKMGTGVTLSKEEIVALRDLLNGLEL